MNKVTSRLITFMIQIGQNDSKCFTCIIGDLYFPMYFHMYPCGVPHTHSKK